MMPTQGKVHFSPVALGRRHYPGILSIGGRNGHRLRRFQLRLRVLKMSTDVAIWLRGLGLEQYATAFLENDVDVEILPKLTADDLIGLGVTSIGHRRKLLDAIATLRDSRSSAASARILSTMLDGQDEGPVIHA